MKLSLGKKPTKKKKTKNKKLTKKQVDKALTKLGKKKKLGKRVSDVKKKRKKKASSVEFMNPTSKAAKRKIEEASAGSLWKPKEGVNRIIILPSTRAMGIGRFPWVSTKSHFIGGKDAMAALGMDKPDDLPMVHGCLKYHQKRSCGWCDFMDRLKKSRYSRDKKLGSAIWPNYGCFCNIVDLKRKKVVRQYRFGTKVEQQLLVALEDGLNFTDHNNLLEVRIRKIKTGKSDMNVEYKVILDRSREVGPIRQEWIDGMEDLSKFIAPLPSPDDIQDAKDLLLASAEAEDSNDIGLESDYDDSDDDDDDDVGW